MKKLWSVIWRFISENRMYSAYEKYVDWETMIMCRDEVGTFDWFKLNKIIKVKFLKPNENVSTNGEVLTEVDIEFDDILKLINQIENDHNGLGRNLHKEAFTGIDYLGNKVQFSSYVIWQEDGKIFKFNFNSDLIPFDSEILRRNRDSKIISII